MYVIVRRHVYVVIITYKFVSIVMSIKYIYINIKCCKCRYILTNKLILNLPFMYPRRTTGKSFAFDTLTPSDVTIAASWGNTVSFMDKSSSFHLFVRHWVCCVVSSRRFSISGSQTVYSCTHTFNNCYELISQSTNKYISHIFAVIC